MNDSKVDADVYRGLFEESDLEVGAPSQGRIPAEQIYELLEAMAANSERDALGLRLSPQLTSDAFASLFQKFRSFERLSEVYEFLQRTYHRVMNGQRIRHRRHGSLHFCEFVIHGRWRAGHGVFADFSLAGAQRLFPRFLEEGFQPLRICLRRKVPAEGRLHEEIFDCPVVYDHPVDMHCFRDQPVTGDPDTTPGASGEGLVDELLPEESEEGESSFVETVEKLMGSEELGVDPDLDQLAAELHASPRTVQRRLRREGVTYRLLRKEHLASIATEMLLDGTAHKDVAARLGYSEPASFARGFHRWLGMYPDAFLELHADS